MIAAPTTATLMMPESAILSVHATASWTPSARRSLVLVDKCSPLHDPTRTRDQERRKPISRTDDRHAEDPDRHRPMATRTIDLVRWVERGVTYARRLPAK
jgi:hypothetical protein